MDRLDRFWVGAATFLLVLGIAGGVAALVRNPGNSSIVILPPQPTSSHPGSIVIEGAVANPGLYPLKDNDTVEGLLEAAGGPTGDADKGLLRLYVPGDGEYPVPQRIDLNRADAWLLEALPGIGSTLAQAIVDYRVAHGPFHLVQDLLRVPGVGEVTLQNIMAYVTVSD
jgi:competence protein ComEA